MTSPSVQEPTIVGASLSGVPLGRAWLRHGEIAGGAVLHVVEALERRERE